MTRLLGIAALLTLLACHVGTAQKTYDYYDGPYLTEYADSVAALYIADGKLTDTVYSKQDGAYTFAYEGLPTVELRQADSLVTQVRYEGVEKYAAISDIHGQYDVFVQLLLAHDIVDSTLQWTYGDGHLVVVGDVLDRGPKVTEALWLLYKLEQEALDAGGRVHVLLGNHELMVMHGDIGYIHPKYRYTAGVTQVPYPDLYSKRTVLGRWLRSKPISVVINDVGFVHGGYSPEVLSSNLSIEKINEVFANTILPGTAADAEANQLTDLLYFDNGPLWYRGYANPKGFDEETAERILDELQLKKIVVGHTSMPKIISIHDEKILLIDSSIKFGKSGELLLSENDTLYAGNLYGSKFRLGREDQPSATSPFEYVYALEDTDLTIVIDTDLGHLMGKNRYKEKYQDATLVAIHNGEFNREWDIRIKTRGNMRKKVCYFPPLKIDFSKETLDYLGFTKNDKLKVVLPCKSADRYKQALYREHIIYQMYQAVDTLGYRTHLVNVRLEDQGRLKHDLQGFFIEDETEYANRTGATVVEDGVIRIQSLDRLAYLKMVFFQYMILNTDFDVNSKHNLELVKVPGRKRLYPIPYDFDYAGIINQDYAVPHQSLPIKEVRDPYLKCEGLTRGELQIIKGFFDSKRAEIEAVIADAVYLTASSKKYMLRDVDSFYQVLDNEYRWSNTFGVFD